jgi:hypothetical protein
MLRKYDLDTRGSGEQLSTDFYILFFENVICSESVPHRLVMRLTLRLVFSDGVRLNLCDNIIAVITHMKRKIRHRVMNGR